MIAYAPALVLLAVGVLAVALVPPIPHPIVCQCSEAPANPTPCPPCPAGWSVNLLGLATLMAALLAAIVYSLAVRSRRQRRRAPTG